MLLNVDVVVLLDDVDVGELALTFLRLFDEGFQVVFSIVVTALKIEKKDNHCYIFFFRN